MGPILGVPYMSALHTRPKIGTPKEDSPYRVCENRRIEQNRTMGGNPQKRKDATERITYIHIHYLEKTRKNQTLRKQGQKPHIQLWKMNQNRLF